MIKFNSKAETLSSLYGALNKGLVLPQFSFTSEDWVNVSGDIDLLWLNRPKWSHEKLIVRSSGEDEDGSIESLAGKFDSVLNVIGDEDLSVAIEKVVESFGAFNSKDQVLIQPMLTDIKISGVAFTRDPNNAGHYYVINFDDTTVDTTSVTSGLTNDLKVYFHAKNANYPKKLWISNLLSLLAELEGLFKNDSLDVEFAIDKKGTVYLLQVRQLILKSKNNNSLDNQDVILSEIQKKFSSLAKPHPYLLGEKSIFGIMPDWNPAEIIGTRPRPLALSLYKELVTDGIWAYQRDNYGYRNLRSFPLLVSLCGLPYIDVRISFNSFIPSDLNEDLADRLVNHYLKSLEEAPTKHDKVEFDIIYSCYTLDLPERLSELKEIGFEEKECNEILKSLRNLTNNIINSEEGLWVKDIKKIEELQSRQSTILESKLSDTEKIYWLIEDCKRYGTLPFAGLARAGFIAVQLLRSMVKVNAISEIEYEDYMSSLDTINSRMQEDLQGQKNQFLKKYGHLRPGTYDILSPRYDEVPDVYFNWNENTSDTKKYFNKEPALSIESINKIEKLLKKHKINHSAKSLFDFIKGAIEGREYAKFIFSRSLSDALSLMKKVANKFDISIEELSYCDVDIIKKLYSSSTNIKESFESSIMHGKERYLKTCSLTLPPLIKSVEDIVSFELPIDEPNYITLKSTHGKVIFEKSPKEDFAGNILLIKSADPGYDWIFSHGIGGFITMYGGANSHMAIRAAELSIPAIIGAGEVLYQQLSRSSVVYINCANKQVRILK
jgi:phosphohistidine swiveling domain-containing protein